MYIASEYDYELFITRTAVRMRQFGKWIFDVVVEGENFDLEHVTVRATKTARLSCLENFLKNEPIKKPLQSMVRTCKTQTSHKYIIT